MPNERINKFMEELKDEVRLMSDKIDRKEEELKTLLYLKRTVEDAMEIIMRVV